jgi:hypothetical protein
MNQANLPSDETVAVRPGHAPASSSNHGSSAETAPLRSSRKSYIAAPNARRNRLAPARQVSNKRSPSIAQPKKRVSQKQLAANRANARKSTGPRTTEGKQRSSLNATRHGLTGQVAVLPGEDLAAFFNFCRQFRESLSPVGFLEEQLAQSLAELRWRLNRVSQLENAVFSLGFDLHGDDTSTGHPEAHAAITNAITYLEHSRQIANLSVIAGRLSRQYEKEFAQLRTLQAERSQRETAALDNAYKFAKSYEVLGKTYDPAEDGFDFSSEYFGKYKAHRNRLELAHNACSVKYTPGACRQLAA